MATAMITARRHRGLKIGGGQIRQFFYWGITGCALRPSEEDKEDRDDELRLFPIIKISNDAENNNNYNIFE